MKSSYQKQLDELITSLSDKKPSLLLHACCAPCSSYVLEYLSEHFQITILYYNPNIYPQTEYERRLQELIDFLPKFEPAIKNKIQLIQTEYNLIYKKLNCTNYILQTLLFLQKILKKRKIVNIELKLSNV